MSNIFQSLFTAQFRQYWCMITNVSSILSCYCLVIDGKGAFSFLLTSRGGFSIGGSEWFFSFGVCISTTTFGDAGSIAVKIYYLEWNILFFNNTVKLKFWSRFSSTYQAYFSICYWTFSIQTNHIYRTGYSDEICKFIKFWLLFNNTKSIMLLRYLFRKVSFDLF